ncbi:hypothetical protein M378DRAFT_168284 [Amanita muscaria Koide BX008]|uniref:Uncharacterized protein n=1 Tax=Amanita muscaria (strain Koide BX008) TaxID=946122 RepID=A0A0C2SBN4_AMAMK|nr:hypothetical protein M378DRAFT_168284 [Amanita muscaria Koide BX008]
MVTDVQYYLIAVIWYKLDCGSQHFQLWPKAIQNDWQLRSRQSGTQGRELGPRSLQLSSNSLDVS